METDLGVERVVHEPIARLYENRRWTAKRDTYFGVPLLKFPEDLRVYEHLIEECQVNVVVEVGTAAGGSALWFRDRLALAGRYLHLPPPAVVTVDIDMAEARRQLRRTDRSYTDTITLIEGDIRDADVVERVHASVPEGARVLVVDDGAHEVDALGASLDGLWPLVSPGSYLVVEDTHISYPALMSAEPRRDGPTLAEFVGDWLTTHTEFVQTREPERYVVTSNPGGYLQRASTVMDRARFAHDMKAALSRYRLMRQHTA